MTYPVELYDETRETVRSSAAVVVPLLARLFRPSSVIDVGCGEGWWVREFQEHDVAAHGIDQHAPDGMMVHDLEAPIPRALVPQHDLALCLEVAEHLSPSRAVPFVGELCQLAPTVIFSAAIPGQGGAGHVNERWPNYWADLFADYGYLGTGALRAAIWDDERIAPWYRQNLLAFGDLGPMVPDGYPSIVHPEIWGWYRG